MYVAKCRPQAVNGVWIVQTGKQLQLPMQDTVKNYFDYDAKQKRLKLTKLAHSAACSQAILQTLKHRFKA